MPIGVPADPVDSDVEINNPVPRAPIDELKEIRDRLTVLERSGNTEIVRQIRWLYDFLGETYPPP